MQDLPENELNCTFLYWGFVMVAALFVLGTLISMESTLSLPDNHLMILCFAPLRQMSSVIDPFRTAFEGKRICGVINSFQ